MGDTSRMAYDANLTQPQKDVIDTDGEHSSSEAPVGEFTTGISV